MNTQEKVKKTGRWWRWSVLGAALAALGLSASRARAGVGNPSYLNIDVSVNASLSVAVNGVNSSSGTALSWSGAANQEFTAGTQGSSVTVTNDSGVAEKWYLSGSTTSVNTVNGGASWTLAGSTYPALPGQDQYALQAVFGSSMTAAGTAGSGSKECPVNGETDWANGTVAPPLTGVPAQYTDTQFADSALNNDGKYQPDLGTGGTSKLSANLTLSGKRVLCWRVIMPNGTSTQDAQNIQLVVTAGD